MARGVRKSLVGKQFGRLKVISYEGTDRFRNGLWKCICSCGVETIERGTELTTGKIISCGHCSNRLSIAPIQKEEEESIYDELIGKKFNMLTIIDIYTKETSTGKKLKYAKCKCDCGKEKGIMLSNVKRGKTISCGCAIQKKKYNTLFLLSDDFVGKRFGRLVVESYDINKKMWKCKCDCGNITYSKKGNLTNGMKKSCGCLQKEKRKKNKK